MFVRYLTILESKLELRLEVSHKRVVKSMHLAVQFQRLQAFAILPSLFVSFDDQQSDRTNYPRGNHNV